MPAGDAVRAAVCHGPAGPVAARLPDGTALVQGRAVTGFSLEEAAVSGKEWAPQFRVPLETALRDGGALWQEAALMMPTVVVDGRPITGRLACTMQLALMQLAEPHMPEPELRLGIAEALWRLDRLPQARDIVAALLAKHPGLKQAQDLQARLNR